MIVLARSIALALGPPATLAVRYRDGPTARSPRLTLGDEANLAVPARRMGVCAASGRSTQRDPIGLAGGLNQYGYVGGDPVNHSDPFGLCPSDVGGDGKTPTVDDCPREVQDAWAKSHIRNTSSNNTDIAGIDSDLMRAIVLTSMEHRMTLGISAGKEEGHSVEGLHSEGFGVDINQANGIRFGAMTDQAAATVGNAIAVGIVNRLSNGFKMVYSPGMAARTNRAMSQEQFYSLLSQHRTHIHVTANPTP